MLRYPDDWGGASRSIVRVSACLHFWALKPFIHCVGCLYNLNFKPGSLGPQNHEKWKFFKPKNFGYNPWKWRLWAPIDVWSSFPSGTDWLRIFCSWCFFDRFAGTGRRYHVSIISGHPDLYVFVCIVDLWFYWWNQSKFVSTLFNLCCFT